MIWSKQYRRARLSQLVGRCLLVYSCTHVIILQGTYQVRTTQLCFPLMQFSFPKEGCVLQLDPLNGIDSKSNCSLIMSLMHVLVYWKWFNVANWPLQCNSFSFEWPAHSFGNAKHYGLCRYSVRCHLYSTLLVEDISILVSMFIHMIFLNYLGSYFRCALSFLPVFQLIIYSNFGYTAHALGDLSVTIEEVTPPVYPSGGLFPSEVYLQLFQSICSPFLSEWCICQFHTPSVMGLVMVVQVICVFFGRKGLWNSLRRTLMPLSTSLM